MFRADKCVIVNDEDSIYYDYLFLFYGEQFTYDNGEIEIKSQKSLKHSYVITLILYFSIHRRVKINIGAPVIGSILFSTHVILSVLQIKYSCK